jgi:hypothetical protein
MPRSAQGKRFLEGGEREPYGLRWHDTAVPSRRPKLFKPPIYQGHPEPRRRVQEKRRHVSALHNCHQHSEAFWSWAGTYPTWAIVPFSGSALPRSRHPGGGSPAPTHLPSTSLPGSDNFKLFVLRSLCHSSVSIGRYDYVRSTVRRHRSPHLCNHALERGDRCG